MNFPSILLLFLILSCTLVVGSVDQVNLISPEGNATLKNSIVSFIVNTTTSDHEINNYTLYTNYTGVFTQGTNTTEFANGTFNTTTLSYNFERNDTYLWNVQVCDTGNNCSFASTNRSFTIYTTEGYDNWLYSLFILLSLGLIFVGYYGQDITYITLGGILLTLFRFVIITNGFVNLQYETSLVTRSFALLVIGLGLYFLSRSILAYLDIGVGGK